MQDLIETIKNIRLLVLDVDGVLTDNSLYYYRDGEALKKFNARDGQGLKLAEAYDIEIAIISGRESDIVSNRCKELGITRIYQHCHDKRKKIELLSAELGIMLDQIAFVGDDILDVPAMEIVGLPVAPKDAHPTSLKRAKIVTEAVGGNGCVREVIDLILKEQGKITL